MSMRPSQAKGPYTGSDNIFTSGIYLGDPNTDGSWRIRIDGVNLVFERREGGSWIWKGEITP